MSRASMTMTLPVTEASFSAYPVLPKIATPRLSTSSYHSDDDDDHDPLNYSSMSSKVSPDFVKDDSNTPTPTPTMEEDSLDIFLGTWNMNEQEIPYDLKPFLQV